MKHLYVDTNIGTAGDGTSWAQAENKLADAIADLPADLTADDSYTIHCAGTAADTIQVALNGHTTDATHYIVIQCDLTGGRDGGKDRHSAVWTTSKYRLTISGTDSPPIGIYDKHVYIDGLQISFDNSAGFLSGIYCNISNGAEAREYHISNCLITSGAGTPSGKDAIKTQGSSTVTKIWNNIIYSIAGGTGYNRCVVPGSGTVSLFNNTIADTATGIEREGGTVVLKNNLISGCTTATIGTIDTSSDYNATNNASFGTGYTLNTNDHTEHTFSFTGGGDYHLQSGDTGAKNLGVSDPGSGLFSDDIDGVTRTGTWDIGADEISEISGSACWGHSTGVTQDNTRTFATNWTGSGLASGAGDAEILTLDSGESMESEIVNTGATTWTIALNQYDTGDNVTIKYKTAATSAGIAGASWTTYSGAFESSGYVKIRLEHTTQ